MRRTWMTFSLLFGFLVQPHSLVFAQTDTSTDTAQQRTQKELEARQELEAQQKSQKALEDFLRSSKIQNGSSTGVNSMFSQFRMAIPKFRGATDDYRWALSMDGKLEKPLKDIKAQTDVMLTYLEAAKVRHPKTDPSEFKDYSPVELQWETLNSAERIGAFLDFAVVAERQESVSTKTLEFLYTLDGELLRLKWLASHVK
jgi:hypothetical protein